MKIRKQLNKAAALLLTVSTLFVMPVSAADSQNQRVTLAYADIEKQVKENNLQLKANALSIKRLEGDIEDADEGAEEAEDSLYGLVYSINAVMNDMDEIIKKSIPDPANPEAPPSVDQNVAAIAQATRFSLSFTQNNLLSQIESMGDSTEGMEDQVELSKLSLEQAENTLVSTVQNLFVLYHQLTNNLEQLEHSRAKLNDQLTQTRQNLKLGLVTQTLIIDLETSLLELDASCTALVHQRDALLLQMKGLLGLTWKDELTVLDLPLTDRSYVDSIKLNPDIEAAIENAMSIKLKEKELDNKKIYGNSRRYELQLKENEAVLSFTKKYHALLETRDSLRVAESKFNAASLKLEEGKIKYSKGLLSETELKGLESDAKVQELKVKSESAALFNETENYKAMKAGLL